MKKELTNKQIEIMNDFRDAYLKKEKSSIKDYAKRTLNNLISKGYIILADNNIELTEKGKDFLGLLPYEVEINKDIVLKSINEEIELHKRLFNTENYHPSMTQVSYRIYGAINDPNYIREKRVNHIINKLEEEKILRKINHDGFNRYDYQIELI